MTRRLHSKFGIKGKAHALLRSYLTGRTQFVRINGTNSSVHYLKYGVPQGSVLGPLLYLLYTSPLGDIIRKHGIDFHLYADVTQLYTAFSFENNVELSVAIDRIERCLVEIFNWMAVNKLKFNTAGLEITAGQRTMSGLIWELTGQPFVLPVMLTGHI